MARKERRRKRTIEELLALKENVNHQYWTMGHGVTRTAKLCECSIKIVNELLLSKKLWDEVK